MVRQSGCPYTRSGLFSDFHLKCRKHAQKNADGQDEGDADEHDGGDEEFLSLDDVPEGKNLNMKEDFESREVGTKSLHSY